MHAIEADDGKTIDALASMGGEEFESALLEHHPKDELERTPLMLAYWWGKERASVALVNAGSNYLQKDAKGRSASWYARRIGKGREEQAMTNLIDAGERRLSMDSVISKGAKPTKPPPKRRLSDL